ncbi:MAG: hypothetical protein KDD14_19015 [Saprospiraceae bacterium]|nr:hypothetical protein [Saprospiraceae bacterium]
MKLLPVFLFFALLFSCGPTREPLIVQPAFYCWETSPDYSNTDLVQSLGASRIYLRLFDVAWDAVKKNPYPAGLYRSSWMWGGKTEPVPVIFITNETLLHLDSSGVAELAQHIYNKADALLYRVAAFEQEDHYWPYGRTEMDTNYSAAQQLMQKNMTNSEKWLTRIREWQIDCDWTVSTSAKFFYLLTELKRLQPAWSLSCTIRLHQLKYAEKIGVPPVDRGMLMCYNVDDLKDPDTPNSIFNYAESRKYLEPAQAYPLPLDVALPAFRWGVLFHLGKFKCIVPEQDWEAYHEQYFEQKTGNLFQAKSDFTLNDQFVREGDLLRFEVPDQHELLQMIKLLRRQTLAQPMNLAFFHLGSNRTSYDHIPNLQALVAAFR